VSFLFNRIIKGEKMSFLGKPLYVFFGMAAGLCLTTAVFLGLNMRRFGLKIHRIFAFAALGFAILHFLTGAWQYF
jgi:hypothetical protein